MSGEPEDEKRHRIVHENYLTGPKLPILLYGKKVAKFDDFVVVQVSDESTEEVRSSASKLALTAHYSTPDYPAGYDGSVGHELNVYALLYGKHAIGFLLRSKTTRSWYLRWNGEGKAELVTNDANLDKRIVVARLWIAKHYQRKGFARRMIETTAITENQEISNIVYQLPFTPAGKCLIQAIAPDTWFGDGDSFDFRDILKSST